MHVMWVMFMKLSNNLSCILWEWLHRGRVLKTIFKSLYIMKLSGVQLFFIKMWHGVRKVRFKNKVRIFIYWKYDAYFVSNAPYTMFFCIISTFCTALACPYCTSFYRTGFVAQIVLEFASCVALAKSCYLQGWLLHHNTSKSYRSAHKRLNSDSKGV